jgi:hypothetical protein
MEGEEGGRGGGEMAQTYAHMNKCINNKKIKCNCKKINNTLFIRK